MENTIRMFKTQLFSALWNWVETNKDTIGEKNYKWFHEKGKRAEDDCNTGLKIMADALWLFNMMSGWVWVGIGPSRVNEIQYLAEGIDEASTKRLLNIIAACLSLQYLPRNLMTKEIAVISGKHFSLKLFTEAH